MHTTNKTQLQHGKWNMSSYATFIERTIILIKHRTKRTSLKFFNRIRLLSTTDKFTKSKLQLQCAENRRQIRTLHRISLLFAIKVTKLSTFLSCSWRLLWFRYQKESTTPSWI
jgi:hypothetical protein